MASVSIIIPTKNRLELLKVTLHSVQEQTLKDWECIVVDDHSDDGTREFMTQFVKSNPQHRYCLRDGNVTGANVCRNQGIRSALGEFVVFLDSDDLLSKECLANRVIIMRRNPDLDFVVFSGDAFSKTVGDLNRRVNNLSHGSDLDSFLALELPWVITGPMWRRTYLQSLGGFDESLLGSQDLDLHVRALARGPRYWIENSVDHYIRWADDPERISARKGAVSEVVENTGNLAHRWHNILATSGKLSESRVRLLAGVLFQSAEILTRVAGVRRSLCFWRSSISLGIPRVVRLQGYSMLLIRWLLSFESRFANGAIRQWKYRHGLNRRL